MNLGRLNRKITQHSREILPISKERRAMLHYGLESEANLEKNNIELKKQLKDQIVQPDYYECYF